jgi:prephenate dehydratase
LLTEVLDVFEVVQAGEVTAGVVPIENSTNGAVVFTLDDLADRSDLYKDITVDGEVYVDVHHCLVGHKNPSESVKNAIKPEDHSGESGTCTPTASDPSPRRPKSKPLSSLTHIKRLYSHPQAFGQCTAFISTYLKGVEIFEVSSTSKAAEIVSQDTTGTWAAISSTLAGELQGLDFLGRSIEDRDDNTTRFLIIGRNPMPPADWDLTEYDGDQSAGAKSLVSLTVPHESPGALAEVLSCFKAFELNMTSINSRPRLVKPFQYIFFVEFRGDIHNDPEGRVKGVLERIGQVAESSRFLGSWKRYG